VYVVDFDQVDRNGKVYIDNIKIADGIYRGQHKISK
jgi:hypothetical protein